jgi:phosphoesterase RecJ-like protein
MTEYLKIKDVLLHNNNFVITTHLNPDGDAVGSEIAFYYALKKLGKNIHIVNCDETPHYLKFLDPDNIIEVYKTELHDPLLLNSDILIALDFNNPSRISRMSQTFQASTAYKICFDHHQKPADFVNIKIIRADFAATGHIVYDFLKETGIADIDKNIAVGLYAAIMTDTGSFRFDRTTPELHIIIADLISKGADPTSIYNSIFDNNRFGKLRLLGETLSEIRINKTGTIAYMIVTQEALKRTGTSESEIDGFVNYCLSISGVKIGILFFELKEGIKMSFRSKGKIPVNILAEEYHGGGHTNASGARVDNEELNGIIDKVLESAEKILPGY